MCAILEFLINSLKEFTPKLNVVKFAKVVFKWVRNKRAIKSISKIIFAVKYYNYTQKSNNLINALDSNSRPFVDKYFVINNKPKCNFAMFSEYWCD